MVHEPDLVDIEARVRVLEAHAASLATEIDRLRQWRHTLPSELIVPLQHQLLDIQESIKQLAVRAPGGPMPPVPPPQDSFSLTKRDFYVASGAIGLLLAVLRFFHLLG